MPGNDHHIHVALQHDGTRREMSQDTPSALDTDVAESLAVVLRGILTDGLDDPLRVLALAIIHLDNLDPKYRPLHEAATDQELERRGLERQLIEAAFHLLAVWNKVEGWRKKKSVESQARPAEKQEPGNYPECECGGRTVYKDDGMGGHWQECLRCNWEGPREKCAAAKTSPALPGTAHDRLFPSTACPVCGRQVPRHAWGAVCEWCGWEDTTCISCGSKMEWRKRGDMIYCECPTPGCGVHFIQPIGPVKDMDKPAADSASQKGEGV